MTPSNQRAIPVPGHRIIFAPLVRPCVRSCVRPSGCSDSQANDIFGGACTAVKVTDAQQSVHSDSCIRFNSKVLTLITQ